MITTNITNQNPLIVAGFFLLTLNPMDALLTSFWIEYTEVLFNLRWVIVLGVILVISDLWFGLSESRMNHEHIRYSSAGRKTLNKVIDYFLYITLGSLLGKALGEPYGLNPQSVSISVLFLCYAFELDSIYGHICALHGIKKPYSIWKLVVTLLSLKFKTFGDQLKDMQDQSNESKSTKQ